MTAEARFKHGTPKMVDYTPSGAVAAGEVVVVGELALIAHNAIAASKKGALAAGGGTYICTGVVTLLEGQKVWWDSVNNGPTNIASTHKPFGYVAPGHGCTGATECWIIHEPGVDDDSAVVGTSTTTTTTT